MQDEFELRCVRAFIGGIGSAPPDRVRAARSGIRPTVLCAIHAVYYSLVGCLRRLLLLCLGKHEVNGWPKTIARAAAACDKVVAPSPRIAEEAT